ncbi:hypothetical protein NONI108955_44475 [Nocardia ninae]
MLTCTTGIRKFGAVNETQTSPLAMLTRSEQFHLLGEWHSVGKYRSMRPTFQEQRDHAAYETGYVFGLLTGESHQL